MVNVIINSMSVNPRARAAPRPALQGNPVSIAAGEGRSMIVTRQFAHLSAGLLLPRLSIVRLPSLNCGPLAVAVIV